jgi:hypothetical protein
MVRGVTSPEGLTLLTLAMMGVGAYLLAVAATSPIPPLIDTPSAGGAVVVIGWVVFNSLFTFTKVCIAHVLSAGGYRDLLRYGFVTQVGFSLSFAMYAQLVYAAPGHWVCSISGHRPSF